jgi:hypothetical protein
MHLSHLRKWIAASPPVEFVISRIRELLIGALKQGPIPQHIAFVMDGNRRFARSHGIETVEGHNLGFEALARVGSPKIARETSNDGPLQLYFNYGLRHGRLLTKINRYWKSVIRVA